MALTAEQKAKCARCKQAAAAHKGACRMKHCKCEGMQHGR